MSLPNDKQDKCNEYIEQAKRSFNTHNGNSLMMEYDFNEKVDRIRVVKENAEGEDTILDECYNLAKVGEYGICETVKKVEGPNSWGFCSRSCNVDSNLLDEPYEEAEMYFHEIIPPDTFHRFINLSVLHYFLVYFK